MAKAKRRSRRKEAGSVKSDERNSSRNASAQTHDTPPTPNPPRRNLTMLLVSSILLILWLIYLVRIAMFS